MALLRASLVLLLALLAVSGSASSFVRIPDPPSPTSSAATSPSHQAVHIPEGPLPHLSTSSSASTSASAVGEEGLHIPRIPDPESPLHHPSPSSSAATSASPVGEDLRIPDPERPLHHPPPSSSAATSASPVGEEGLQTLRIPEHTASASAPASWAEGDRATTMAVEHLPPSGGNPDPCLAPPASTAPLAPPPRDMTSTDRAASATEARLHLPGDPEPCLSLPASTGPTLEDTTTADRAASTTEARLHLLGNPEPSLALPASTAPVAPPPLDVTAAYRAAAASTTEDRRDSPRPSTPPTALVHGYSKEANSARGSLVLPAATPASPPRSSSTPPASPCVFNVYVGGGVAAEVIRGSSGTTVHVDQDDTVSDSDYQDDHDDDGDGGDGGDGGDSTNKLVSRICKVIDWAEYIMTNLP